MGWGMKHLKMMRWKGGKDGESALHTEWKNSGGWSMKGALFTLAGLAQNPGGRGAQAKTAEEQRCDGAPANCAGRAGRIGQPKAGAAASVKGWRRPGQLACPEDT